MKIINSLLSARRKLPEDFIRFLLSMSLFGFSVSIMNTIFNNFLNEEFSTGNFQRGILELGIAQTIAELVERLVLEIHVGLAVADVVVGKIAELLSRLVDRQRQPARGAFGASVANCCWLAFKPVQ